RRVHQAIPRRVRGAPALAPRYRATGRRNVLPNRLARVGQPLRPRLDGLLLPPQPAASLRGPRGWARDGPVPRRPDVSDLAAFLNHLASAIPGWPDECPQWDAFRRARALRRIGHDLGPGLNAACDLALHAHANSSPEDVDVALTAAHHA